MLTTVTIIARIQLKPRNLSKFWACCQVWTLRSKKSAQHSNQFSNQFSFMRHNKRQIWVKKVDGIQKIFIIKKSLFSQKAIVQIKNLWLHWIYLFFWQHKPSSEPRKNFSCIVATYIRTVKNVYFKTRSKMCLDWIHTYPA